MQPNLVAVIVAGVVNMVIGAGWYGALAKPWMRLNGIAEEDMEKARSKMAPVYAVNMLTSLVMAYVLGMFVKSSGALSLLDGMQIGLWAWLGLIVCTFVPNYLYADRPKKLLLIDIMYYAVSLPVMGALFVMWG